MRFSRLSRVRRLLGHHGPPHYWPDADKVAIDANYLAVDLVANVAADDLLLCFIHAAVDLTPHDNDQHPRSPWSNWCGTNAFTIDQAPALQEALFRAVPPSSSQPTRIFQISAGLSNHPHALLFSWPPDSPLSHGPSARDFARLSEGVNIDPESIAASTAKTSCTRRFKVREQAMNSQDAYRLVDSVFIPHGSIVFACHQVVQQRNATMPVAAAAPSAHSSSLHSLYMSQPHQQYLDPSFSLPSMQSLGSYQLSSAQHHVPAHSYPAWQPSQAAQQQQQSVEQQQQQQPSSYGAWPPSASPYTQTPTTSQQPQTYAPPPQPPQPAQAQPAPWPYSPEPEPYRSSSPMQQQQQLPPPPQSYYPPPTHEGPQQASFGGTDEQSRGPRRTSPTTAGARSGHPPAGVLRCSSCRVTQSPEWRKGPSGKKDLCNACGLRYARSRAKKEGVPAQRRKREATAAVLRVATAKRSEAQQQQPGPSANDVAVAQPPPPPSMAVGPPPAPYRRESYDTSIPYGSQGEYPAVGTQGSVGSTPSPPAYQGKEQPRYYHHTAPSLPGQTQLPPFHELPHTLSPSIAPTRAPTF